MVPRPADDVTDTELAMLRVPFLSGSSPRTLSPVGATGVGRVLPLQRRLSMILRDPTAGLMGRPAPRTLPIIGILSLLLLPAWSSGQRLESLTR